MLFQNNILKTIFSKQSLHPNTRSCHERNFVRIYVDIYNIPKKEVIKMLSIAVCDDEVIEYCSMAKRAAESRP